MKQYIRIMKRYSFLLEQLVKKEIKLKYRNSILGLFWTLLEPFLTMIVLTLVFNGLYGHKTPEFPVYILAGRLLYTFFSSSTKACTKSIRRNAAMIKKVYVPKYIYPIASILANYIMFLISLVVLIGTAIVVKVWPTIYLIQAIVPLVLVLFSALGVGLILATLAVFFRDLEYLWGVCLMLIMYTCAIFYYPDRLILNGRGYILKMNPLYAIIKIFRDSIFGRPMEVYYLVFSAIFSVATVIIGIVVFKKNQDKFILNI